MYPLTTRKLNAYTLLTSVLTHVLIFAAIGLYWDFSPQPVTLGNPTTTVVQSYLFQDNATQLSSAQTQQTSRAQDSSKNLAQHKAKNALEKITHQHRPDPTQAKSAATHASTPHSLASNGQPTSKLIALLHAAIQKQQHYPPAALQMEREGRVTVKFTLHTNGNISHLKVVNSSGTTSLDEAAVAAVQEAAPFYQVVDYLHDVQEYRIDVVFALT